MSSISLQQPAEDRGWLLVFICWLALTLAWSIPNLATLAAFTGSTDDTMRLVQVRGLLDGAGWYGLHEPRLNPPSGLDSHWSRLVDAPIAALILIGGWFFNPQGAELFALIAWPALVYLTMMVGFVLIGLRLAPAAGPLPMIAAFIACLPVMGYFKPLAIDHHNVQMALAVLLIAAAVWANDKAGAALAGGVLGALIPAIGFESLHLLVAVELLVLGLAVFGGAKQRRAAMLWFAAQAAMIGPVYLINTPPDWLLRTGCDALQLNMVAMLGLGSLGLAVLMVIGRESRVLPLALAVAAIGAAALGLGLWLDPACIAGPNARVAPEAISRWMVHVEEAAPWNLLFAFNPSQAALFAVYPLLTILAAALLAYRRMLDAPVFVLLAAMLVATLVMLTQVRGFTYAAITGAIVIAVAGCRLFPGAGAGPVKRIAASAVLPALACLSTLFLAGAPQAATPQPALTSAEAAPKEDEPARRPEELCASRAGFAALAREPEGLVLSHIDLGPAILLNTRHSVVMAPYHRADKGIIAGFRLFEAPAVEAREALRAAGIRYLADCIKLVDPIDRATHPAPLRDAALGKIPLPWLEALPTDSAFPDLRFWRVN